MTTHQRAHKLARVGAILITGVAVFMIIAWLRLDPEQNASTDWTAFDNAADRVISGDTIYRPWGLETEPYPYLYPPYVLWLALPLAAVGFWGSFLISALAPLIAYVTGLKLLIRAEVANSDHLTGLTLAIASGATVGATLVGQYSGIYVLAFGLATLFYTKDRHTLAGVALALLWIKPNIAVVVPVALLWSRSWRTLRGFGAGTLGLLLLSVPFGPEQWVGFVENIRDMAELQQQGLVPVDKMVTVLSSVQAVFGLETNVVGSTTVWLATCAVLGVAVLVLWTPARLAESPIRAFGALAVFAVIANPRVYFYDSALLTFGMLGLWMSANVRGDLWLRRLIPSLFVLLWIGLWGSVFSALNPIVGPVGALTLVLTAFDSHRSGSATVRIEPGLAVANVDAAEYLAEDAA